MSNLQNAPTTTASPDPITLRTAFGKYATGVTVVTTVHDGAAFGMTANSFSSLSLDPPLVLWSVRRSSTNFVQFTEAKHFAVNILATDQIEMSRRFAKSGPDKFAGLSFATGVGGSPVLPDTAAVFECETVGCHDGGDHVIIVGRIERLSYNDRKPLVFVDGRYVAAVEHSATRTQGATEDQEQGSAVRNLVSMVLLRAHNGIVDKLNAAREKTGISVNESRMLNTIAAHPGTRSQILPMTFLAELAADDAVAQLKERGLVDVAAGGRLTATSAGIQQSTELVADYVRMEAQILSSLSAEEIAALRHALGAIVQATAN